MLQMNTNPVSSQGHTCMTVRSSASGLARKCNVKCLTVYSAKLMCCQLQPMQQLLNYFWKAMPNVMTDESAPRIQPKRKIADTCTLHPAACQFRF